MNRKYVIQISEKLWMQTRNGLCERSRGNRETACIWAGHRSLKIQVVDRVFFLDDLVGVRGSALRHNVPREAIDFLFSTLKEKGLVIVADLHTHPGDWVGLSSVDMEHPIEYRIGLLMIVFPRYAKPPVAFDGIGVHEYQGKKWKKLPLAEVRQRLIIMRSFK